MMHGAGWYRDPTGRFEQRYWDGVRWTEHVSKDGAPLIDSAGGFGPPQMPGHLAPQLIPGSVAVWITAVLSITVFYFRMTRWPGGTTSFVLPIGLLFTLWCWRIVVRARRVCAAQGISLPSGFQTALILSLVLGGISTITSIVSLMSRN